MGDSIRDELVNAFAEAGKEVPQVDTPDALAESPPADAPSAEVPSTESARERSPDGKFKPKDTPEEGAAVEAAKVEGESQPTEEVKYPKSWSAEMKAKFIELPPDVKSYILKRDVDSSSAIGKASSELDRVRKEYTEIDQVIEPFRERLALAGERPAQAIQRLVAAQLYLERAPEEAIGWLAKSYGVDLGRLTQNPQQPTQSDPLMQRIQQLEGFITSQTQSQQQQVMTGIVSEIDKFAQTAEFFEDVKAEMPALVQLVKGQNPQMSHQEVLKTAYDRAVWANPHTRALISRKQADETAAKQREEKAKAAKEAERKGFSVTGSPSGMPSAQEDDSLRGQLQAAFRQHRVS